MPALLANRRIHLWIPIMAYYFPLQRCDTVKLEQHRLKCSVVEPLESSNVHTNGNAAHYTSPDDLHEKVDQLRKLVGSRHLLARVFELGEYVPMKMR